MLNANYMRARLGDVLPAANDGFCMHEFVVSLEGLKKETGVSAMDVAKSLIDAGMHPPTMYFPLIVHEALMFEPTETEGKETLDAAVDAVKKILAARKDRAGKIAPFARDHAHRAAGRSGSCAQPHPTI